MELEINKQKITVAKGISTLAQLLAHEGLDGLGLAVAVDMQLAPRKDWDNIQLTEGMKITVIRAVCGG